MENIDPLQQIPRLYHFTDRRNLTLIRQYGGLFSHAELRRRQIVVPAPGGNQWSLDADQISGMDGYVHLCFRSNHPMEYLARQDGRIIDSIFLEIHPSVLQVPEVRFSPGVSNRADAEYFAIDQARVMIDFQVLYTRTDWHDAAIQERLRAAEKAEILIPGHISLNLIRNIPNG